MTTTLEQFIKERGFAFIPDFSGEFVRFERTREKKTDGFHQSERFGHHLEVRFGDWYTKEEYFWKSDMPQDPKAAAELSAYILEEKEKRAKAKENKQRWTAEEVDILFQECLTMGETPYMVKKKIPKLYGARITPDDTSNLFIPIRDIQGKIWSRQLIESDGTKNFKRDGRIKGCMHILGTIDPRGKVYVCEGFATGASIFQATWIPTVCAFFSGNLQAVCLALKSRYPEAQITICADNDQWNNHIPGNPGIDAAKAAAKTSGAVYRFPSFPLSSDSSGNSIDRPTDYNDLHILSGLAEVKRQLEAEPVDEPSEPGGSEQAAGGSEDPKDKIAQARQFMNKTVEKFNNEHQYKLLDGSKLCYIWTGTHYTELNNQYIRRFAQENLKPAPEKKRREEFLDRIQISNLTPTGWFNESTNRHINLKNGVLNIDTGKLEKHSPDRGFRYCLGYDYNPEATCPTYDAMMKKITCGDRELEMVLDEYAGYALSFDRIWAHKILVLTGEGENGKSTWTTVLRNLAGEGNYCASFLKDLEKEGNRQALDGKLFNICAEVPKKAAFNSTTIKALSAGDPVDVRRLYSNPYTMRNRAKLIFACNQLPDSEDTTTGFFRRFIIVPFNAVFTDADPDFDPMVEEKLQGELSGIFNRVFDGYKRLYTNRRFTASRTSTDAMIQYQLDIDSCRRWVKDHLLITDINEISKDEFTSLKEIYMHYAMTQKNDHVEPLNSVDFGRRLAKVIPDYKNRIEKRTKDKEQVRGLINVVYQPGAGF